MSRLRRTILLATLLLTAPVLLPQAFVESRIAARIKTLPTLSGFERAAAITEMADEIRSLDPSSRKLSLADSLARTALESDPGHDALQNVAFSLANAISQSPPVAKGHLPPAPYMDLALLARSAQITISLSDPLFAQALAILAARDADVQKADFTLTSLHGQKFTLSQLRGKIVLINFWDTACVPCRTEMPYLEAIYTKFQSQGMIVLSITHDDPLRVSQAVSAWNYHPPVLFDTDLSVSRQFHVDTVPRTFLFDRQGKLLAQSLGPCSRDQFLEMLTHTDLRP